MSTHYAIEHNLHDVLRVFARCRNAKELQRLPEYRDHRQEIDRVVDEVAYDLTIAPTRKVKHALRVLQWNIERGKKLDEIKRCLQHHPYMSQADVLILTETDIGMARSGNRHVAQEIARELGYHYVYVNSYLCITKGTREELHAEGENQLGLHGIAIFSRLKITSWNVIPLPHWLDMIRGPEKRLGRKRAVVAMVESESGPVAVAGVHLEAHSSPSQRRKQMRVVLDGIEAFVPKGVPVIIGGDFNTTTCSAFNKRGLIYNICLHLWRGIKRSVEIDHVYPDLYYEKLFHDVLALGYNYQAWNESGVGTFLYDRNFNHDREMVKQFLPEIGVRVFEKLIARWDYKLEAKLDWFMGRGLKVLGDGEHTEDGFRSERPQVIKNVHRREQEQFSDHMPIGVDVLI